MSSEPPKKKRRKEEKKHLIDCVDRSIIERLLLKKRIEVCTRSYLVCTPYDKLKHRVLLGDSVYGCDIYMDFSLPEGKKNKRPLKTNLEPFKPIIVTAYERPDIYMDEDNDELHSLYPTLIEMIYDRLPGPETWTQDEGGCCGMPTVCAKMMLKWM